MMATPPTLLLVEDDRTDADLIMRALERVQLPARVVHLKDGDEAIAYLGGDQPYQDRRVHPLPLFVLMDLKMPRRSGFEVLEWMRRQNSAVQLLPVIVLSSSYTATDIDRAYQLGVNSYLVKPDTTDQLHGLMNVVKSYWIEHNHGPRGVRGTGQAGRA